MLVFDKKNPNLTMGTVPIVRKGARITANPFLQQSMNN